MADEMMRSEFIDYMKAFEKRLNGRFESIDGRFESIDGRLESFDGRLESFDGRLESFDGRLESLDGRVESLDGRLESLDGRVESLDGRVETLNGSFRSLEGSMKVQFEAVRTDLRLSFEAVAALRETTERGFAEMRVDHKQQIGLLETAIKHVRGRVERLERTKRRRD